MSTPVTGSTLLGILPTTVRKIVYSLFGSAGVAIGGIQVAYAAAGHGQPTWVPVVTAVLVFLGIPVSATALLHVTPPAAAAPAKVTNVYPGPITGTRVLTEAQKVVTSLAAQVAAGGGTAPITLSAEDAATLAADKPPVA